MNTAIIFLSLFLGSGFCDTSLDSYLGKYKAPGPVYAKIYLDQSNLVLAKTDLRGKDPVQASSILVPDGESRFSFKTATGLETKVIFRKGQPLGIRSFAILSTEPTLIFTEISDSNKK